jgi:hypothetical protein
VTRPRTLALLTVSWLYETGTTRENNAKTHAFRDKILDHMNPPEMNYTAAQARKLLDSQKTKRAI